MLLAAGCTGGSGGATPPLSMPDQQPAITTPSQDSQVTPSTDSTISTTSQSTALTTTVTLGVPLHVLTAGIVYGYGGTPTTISVTRVKPYVSWAQTAEPYAPILRANGVKVDVYMNFWRNYSHDNPILGYADLKPGGAHASAEAKTCSGSVIKDPSYGGGYEADARKPSAYAHASILASYREQEYAGNYDAIFTDDTDAMGGIALPCNYSMSTYQSAINTINTNLRAKIFFSAFGAVSSPPTQVPLLTPANVIGGMCEICYSGHNNSTNADIAHTGSRWDGIENAEIQTVAKHKIFWVYPRSINPASSEVALRKYVYASFLLSYNPSYAMLQESFYTNSGFPFMPETGLVPMNPLTTASTVTGYLRSGGAYMREFGACYYRGVNHGKCAVVVNPQSYTVAVPTTAYSHSLGLVGSGVLDGGYVTFTGGRPSSLPTANAAILFP